MAETQLSGASGAVKKMTSAWDAFSIAAVSRYAPALQGLAEHLTGLIAGELPETGRKIQEGNVKNIESGIKGDFIQSPYPFMSDTKFQKGYEVFKLQENQRRGLPDTRTKAEKIKFESGITRPVTDEQSIKLYKDMYEAEKKGSGERAKELEGRTTKIREIYSLETSLKSGEKESPLFELVKSIQKQENTIIIKAPKGTIENEKALPANIKLVETF